MASIARIAFAVLLTMFIVALSACRSGETTTGETVTTQIQDTVSQAGDATIVLQDTLPRWSAAIERVGVGIGVNGEAVVNAGTTGAFAEIDMEGGEPGATYPWHVHHGDCGEGGEPVGVATAYPPVVVGQDGEGEAEATIGQPLDVEADYSVNIHLSPAQLDSIIACGELVRLQVQTQ